MTYGYIRVSTAAQNPKRQRVNILSEFPGAKIIEEIFTGTTVERPAFQCLLKKVKPGDVIVFDEISRMSRDAASGYQLYRQLYDAGVDLVFLKERSLNTSVFRATAQIAMTGEEIPDLFIEAANKTLWILAERQILEAFRAAETEVQMLHKRVGEGIRQAVFRWNADEEAGRSHDKRKPGRQAGTTLTTTKGKAALEIIRKHSKTFGGTLSDAECQKLAGISRNTYYNLKRQIRDQLTEAGSEADRQLIERMR